MYIVQNGDSIDFLFSAPLNLGQACGLTPSTPVKHNLAGRLSDGGAKPSKITKMKRWIHTKV